MKASHRTWNFILLLAFAAATLPHAWAQESGGLNFNVLSPDQEANMGISEFEKYKKEKPIVRSGAQYDMLQRVGSRMVQVVPVPNAQWEFVLFQDNSPNAFALPGGKVGVHTGLFKVVQNEAQLAAVVGHELAHVKERHSGERISSAVVGSTLGGLAGVLLQKKGVSKNTAEGVTQGAAMLNLLRFSRKQELEADHFGTIYMAKSGYNPNEAITLWTRFAEYKANASGNQPPAFLSTHPVDSRRIEELKRIMPEALKYYKPGKVSGGAVNVAPTTPASEPAAPAAKPSSQPPKATRPGFRSIFGGGN